MTANSKQSAFKTIRKILSTGKAVLVPVADTISDLYLIYSYYSLNENDRAITLLAIFLISHFLCCFVIFYRLRKQEAVAVWDSIPKRVCFVFATLFTLGPVVLKLVEIYGEEDREHGARKPTCYSKLTLCFFECLPQFVANVYYICHDGCFTIEQLISLVLSLAAACYAVQRYTNPASEKLSRPIENTVYALWIFCTLVGNVLPVALIAGIFSRYFLISAIFPVYLMTFLMLCRAIMVDMILLSKKGKETSSMRFLYATFVIESEDHISPRFQRIFTSVALLTFIMQLAYLIVYLVYVVLQLGSPDIFTPPYKSCGGFDLYRYPTIIFSLSLSFLLTSFIFFFTIILNEWKSVQDVVYKFCPCFAICARPGYDVNEHDLSVPGEKNTDIEEAMRWATLDDGEPVIVRTIPRTISVFDSNVTGRENLLPLYSPTTRTDQIKHGRDEDLFRKLDHRDKEQDDENSLPQSPRLGNHSCKSTQLVYFKKRTSTLHNEHKSLQTVGEESVM